MWEKIENFLFDILGLFVPGIVFLITLVITFFSLVSNNIWQQFLLKINKDSIVIIKFVTPIIKNTDGKNFVYIILFVILLSYLLGHIIKVFSKIFYDACIVLFDLFLIRCMKYLSNKISQFAKKTYRKYKQLIVSKDFFLEKNLLKKILIMETFPFVQILEFIRNLIKFTTNLTVEIFTFKAKKYEEANESLVNETVKMINKKYNVEYPETWYSIYKLSKTIMSHENLKNLGDTFLAKYNLYRSLSFISFINLLLTVFLYFFMSQYLNPFFKVICPILGVLHFLFWYTFHEKYKRYFRLCGNETLIALFYFFKKTQANDTST